MSSKLRKAFLKETGWEKEDTSFHNHLLHALIDQAHGGDLACITPALIREYAGIVAGMAEKKGGGAFHNKGPAKPVIHKTLGRGEKGQKFTVFFVLCQNIPFLVSTVNNAFDECQLTSRLLLHPVVSTEKDASSVAVIIAHLPLLKKEQEDNFHNALKQGITDNIAAVGDWHLMEAKLRHMTDDIKNNPGKRGEPECEEAKALAHWLLDDHFTLLGYRQHSFDMNKKTPLLATSEEKGLGILRKEDRIIFDRLIPGQPLPPERITAEKARAPLVHVSKANRFSRVHRHAHLDVVTFKRFSALGKITGEDVFVGLFTSTAHNSHVTDVPLLRRRVQKLHRKLEIRPGSHNARVLEHILNTYPRSDLWQIDESLLLEHSVALVQATDRPQPLLLLRRDSFDRFITVHIYIPRDFYELRLKPILTKIIERHFAGLVTRFDVTISDSTFARIILIVKTTPGSIPNYKQADIEAEIADAARPWAEKLEGPLFKHFSKDDPQNLIERYGNAFPPEYRSRFTPGDAIDDIRLAEQALKEDDVCFDFIDAPHEERGLAAKSGMRRVLLKIYRWNQSMILSEFMPFIDHANMRALAESRYIITPPGDEALFLHIFSLEVPLETNPPAICENLIVMLKALRSTPSQSDGLNNLILKEVKWRNICLLRAFVSALRQGGFPLPSSSIRNCFVRHSTIIKDILILFDVFFNPARKTPDRTKSAKKIETDINTRLADVSSLEEDRIIRTLLMLVKAIQRTNFYQLEGGEHKPFISFKIASREVDYLPAPRPLYEIFVHSPRFEGVHLRFGKVARGGLRWSDRPADFRTEILGLVKAQQVKNAVIIPVGSKGGFVLHNKMPDRKSLMAEGIACYSLFISALLDITDNLSRQKLTPPVDVVRRDGDDSYLVVAADKGTASFSDIANGVAVEKGFWLNDAFASGGSAGYDHKKMGITARGAWESVRHHFWRNGHDCQKEPFDVIGVGDMSGDVFGNGMLLSKQIRLVVAFNHLHIFIDPAPDPASSFAERERLFALERSTWEDYNKSLISKGGGIFNRAEKALALSEEIRTRFGIDKPSLTPDQLIQHILKAEADLLWFGGIGTYIKASSEAHIEVGDHGNDSLRVNAIDVRAKIIGEGANLGMTQKARIEFSRKGGQCNSDAIDNSAGVDCSDHEVNIKILLGEAIGAGKLERGKRDRLLHSMTDDVAAHVLNNNYWQNRVLSLTESYNSALLDSHQQLIRQFERGGHLERAIEFLPSDEDIEDFRRTKNGLSRPSLCVLLAYAKNIAFQEILDSDAPDDSFLAPYLANYFPGALHKNYAGEIQHHQLKREIIATWLSNSLINFAGIDAIGNIQRQTGASTGDIAKCWVAVLDIFALAPLVDEIRSLDFKMAADTQARMLFETGQFIQRSIEWFLRNTEQDKVADMVEGYKSGVENLRKNLKALLPESLKGQMTKRGRRFEGNEVPEALWQRIGRLKTESSLCEIFHIAMVSKADSIDTARCYFAFSERFGLDKIRSAANAIATHDRWERMACNAVINDLWALQARLTLDAMKQNKPKPFEKWLARKEKSLRNVDQITGEIFLVDSLNISKTVILARILGELAQ